MGGTYYPRLAEQTKTSPWFTVSVSGTDSAPVVFRQYPGQRAVVDSAFGCSTPDYNAIKEVIRLTGSYVRLMGFEITNSDPRCRVLDICGSNPTVRRGDALVMLNSSGSAAVNLVVHDTGQGIADQISNKRTFTYGNLIYANGWDAPDRTHGHGIYTQNDGDPKRHRENLIYNNLSSGLKVYAEGTATNNISCEGNVVFNDAVILGGNRPLKDFQYLGNYHYVDDVDLLWSDKYTSIGLLPRPPGRTWTIAGNYFAAGLRLTGFSDIVLENNLFAYVIPNGRPQTQLVQLYPSVHDFKIVAGGNTYYRSHALAKEWYYSERWEAAEGIPTPKTGFYTWEEWRLLGRDCDESHPSFYYINRRIPPNAVFVRPNEFEAGRAHIIVYNWEELDTVSADLSAVLAPGEPFEILDSQNHAGPPVLTGVFDGRPVELPMDLKVLAGGIGFESEYRLAKACSTENSPPSSQTIAGRYKPIHSSKRFNTFILQRRQVTGSAAVPLPCEQFPRASRAVIEIGVRPDRLDHPRTEVACGAGQEATVEAIIGPMYHRVVFLDSEGRTVERTEISRIEVLEEKQ
jgi:hypothetical protein